MNDKDRSVFVNVPALRGHERLTMVGDWWNSPDEVAATEAMLVRAGVLPYDELAYYRSKPWKWTRERTVARFLERTFEMSGVPVEEAWEMTGIEMMAAMQERDAKRGLGA